MDKTLQINEWLTVTGQVQLEQLKQATQEGFRSVLNLRSPDELGFWQDEQQIVETMGLQYAHVSFKLDKLDEALISKILRRLEQLPKPVVIHCAAGMRSAAIALLSTAVQQGLTPEQTLAMARSLGFHYVDCTLISPHLRECFVNYIDRHAKVAVTAA